MSLTAQSVIAYPSPALASRLRRVGPSPTARLHRRLLELRAQGHRVIGLAVGEPDIGPPEHVLHAAKAAIDAGATRYTAVTGTWDLRRAIAVDSERRRRVKHSPEEVIVSVGAKHSLFNLCFALLGPGTEAVIPTPCWVSYADQCRLAGALPVLVDTKKEDGYRLSAERLRQVLTPKTRALILCSPSNPTGAVYSARELAELATVLREHSCWIVVDEIYSTFVYGSVQHHSLLEVAPDLRDRTLIVDGVSKRFAMTGFRIGWTLAPRRVVEACETLQSQTTTSATTAAQYAATAALNGPEDHTERLRRVFESRRTLALDRLRALPDVEYDEPGGAFYILLDVRPFLRVTRANGGPTTDTEVAEAILDTCRVALAPGAGFAAPGHLRLSYVTNEGELREAIRRLAGYFSRRACLSSSRSF